MVRCSLRPVDLGSWDVRWPGEAVCKSYAGRVRLLIWQVQLSKSAKGKTCRSKGRTVWARRALHLSRCACLLSSFLPFCFSPRRNKYQPPCCYPCLYRVATTARCTIPQMAE